MLEFIVLGQIPGTNIQISFPVIMAVLLAGVFIVRRALRQYKSKENA